MASDPFLWQSASPIARRHLAWVFALAVQGYPIVGILAAIVGLSAEQSSIPFRIVVIALSGLLVLRWAIRGLPTRFDTPLLVFWGVYLVRLGYDTTIAGVAGADFALAFFLGTVLLPSLAIMTAAPAYRERTTALALFTVAALVSILGIVTQLVGIGADASTTEDFGRLGFTTVNPITFGYAGVNAILTAIVLWPAARSAPARATLLVGSAFGLAILIQSASRGPFVALLFTLGVFVLTGRFWRVIAGIGGVGVAVLLAIALSGGLPKTSALDDLVLVARFTNIDQDQSALERLAAQANAVQEFVDHPLTGNAYIDPLTGSYPHNLIIESAMAMGIGGLVFFLYLLGRGFTQALRALARGERLLPFMFLTALVNDQLSGTFWGDAQGFIALTMLALLASRAVPSSQDVMVPA